VPSTWKVKFSEISDVMPRDTKKVTLEERAAALKSRAEGFLKLHGE
jgi:hypothetical protein